VGARKGARRALWCRANAGRASKGLRASGASVIVPAVHQQRLVRDWHVGDFRGHDDSPARRLHMRTRKMMPMMAMVAVAVVLSWAVTAFAGDPNSGVAPPTSSPHGKTYGEWAAEHAKWGMAIPLGVNPANDADGSQCAINQAGPVWFLAGTFTGNASRNCTIPAGRAIFFPLDAYFDDYPCPDPNFRPAPGQSLEAFSSPTPRLSSTLSTNWRRISTAGCLPISFRTGPTRACSRSRRPSACMTSMGA